MEVTRGDTVLVRTSGGYPRLRRLWSYDRIRAVVAEESAYTKLERGVAPWLAGGVVGVPVEDVFIYDGSVQVNPQGPFAAWDRLCPLLTARAG